MRKSQKCGSQYSTILREECDGSDEKWYCGGGCSSASVNAGCRIHSPLSVATACCKRRLIVVVGMWRRMSSACVNAGCRIHLW